MGRGGKADFGPGKETDLRLDNTFTEFLEPNFDVSQYASNALAETSTNAQAKIESLEAGIRLLDEKLSREVLIRQTELLEQANSLRDAEGAIQEEGLLIQGIALAHESLSTALRRVRGEVVDPYKAMQQKTLHLKNLQGTTDLLRHTVQSLKLIQRLKTLVGANGSGTSSGNLQGLGILDLGKAAKLLSDISSNGEGKNLERLQVIARELEFLEATKLQIQTQAQASLDKGMETLSQAEVGSALQIFFNLQQLSQAVESLVEGYARRLRKKLVDALNPKRLLSDAGSGPASLLQGGSRAVAATAKVQEGLWQGLSAFMDQLLQSTVAVWHLQRVIAKKRDPLTHVLFLDSHGSLPLSQFWTRCCEIIGSCIDEATAASKGGAAREALIYGYPRLASLIDAFFKRLHQETKIKGVQPGASRDEEEAFLKATSACQSLYLGSVLSRVSDAASAVFAGGSKPLPTAAELHRYIGHLHEELKAVADSHRLATLTAQTVGKSLQLLVERAESMSPGGQEVRAIGGACTSAQMRIFTLCNQLQEISRSFSSFLPRLPTQAAAILRSPLEALEAGSVEVVLRVMKALVDRGEAILLKMHEQSFGSEGTPTVTSASACIVEFARHLSHSRIEYLSKFTPSATSQHSASIGSALTQRFASRMLAFFVRHASLLKPLSQAGKLQLAKDISELEEAVASNLWPVDQLQAPQKTLRNFRRLLFLGDDALEGDPLLTDLPPILVLQHLHSRGPDALKLPHTESNLTFKQYSLWLDQHSTEEALERIKLSLHSCQDAAAAGGAGALHALMLQLCEHKRQ